MADAPAFDPTRPFEPVAAAPAFDASKSFESIAAPAFDPSRPFERADSTSMHPPQSSYEQFKAKSEAAGGPDIMARTISGAIDTMGQGPSREAPAAPQPRAPWEFWKSPVPVTPEMPGIIKGAAELASAPFGLIQQGAAKGISGITGGIVTPEEAETALLAMRPAGRPVKIPGREVTHSIELPGGSTQIATQEPARWEWQSPPPQAPKVKPPTTQELFAAADQNYTTARGLGVELHPEFFDDLASQIHADLDANGFDPEGKTFKAVDRLRNPSGENVTINDIDITRKRLGRIAREPLAGSERAAARQAISAIDEHMASLTAEDAAVNEHFVPQLADEMTQARGNYAAAMRSQTIDKKQYAAELRAAGSGSGANINNAIRQRITDILLSPKQRQGFSADEIAQMERISKGTFVGNAGRLIGKLFPSGVVSGGISGLAGHALAGIYGVPAIWTVGGAGKMVGDLSTAMNVARLSKQVRMRSPLAQGMQTRAGLAVPTEGEATAGVAGPMPATNSGFAGALNEQPQPSPAAPVIEHDIPGALPATLRASSQPATQAPPQRQGPMITPAPAAQRALPAPRPAPTPEPEPPVTEVRKAAPFGPRARDESTYSLLEYLAARGGLSPIGEVRTIFGGKNKRVFGFGNLIRRGGMSLDDAVQAAKDGGYLRDTAESQGRTAEVGHSDLLDLIDAENRGQKQYREGYTPKSKVDKAQYLDALERHADGYFEDVGVNPRAIDSNIRARMLQIMDKERLAPSVAHERAVMEADEHAIEQGKSPRRATNIPGWDVPDERAGSSPARHAAAQARGPGGDQHRQAARPRRQGDRGSQAPPDATPRNQKVNPEEPPFARGGRINSYAEGGDVAPSLSEYGITADDPQGKILASTAGKIASGGFSGLSEPAGVEQPEWSKNLGVVAHWATDLPGGGIPIGAISPLAAAKPFYSAAEEAIHAAKLNAAPGGQWLGYLKNQPGVKPEELQWLGLEDYLKGQSGKVSQQDLADYVRANKVEVSDVHRGDLLSRDIEAQRVEPIGTAGLQYLRSSQDIADAKRFNLQFGASVEGMSDEQILAAAERLRAAQGLKPPKFSQYTLPGGANYRELLLTLPSKPLDPEPFAKQFYENWAQRGGDPAWEHLTPEKRQEWIAAANEQANVLNKGPNNFQSSHWDEPNVVAHVRFDDRMIGNDKTLHIAEIQSDWHQKGRKQGYAVSEDEKNRMAAELEQIQKERADPSTPKDRLVELYRREGELTDAYNRGVHDAVPDAPFKTSWPELSLKRMIRYAAENGYDRISWDTGATNAERYDLSKHIDQLRYYVHPDGTYDLSATTKQGRGHDLASNIKPDNLADHVGKEMAEKIARGEGDPDKSTGRWRSFSGLDLKVGGEGMLGFYDDILPKAANKLVKKYGAKVGIEQIEAPAAVKQGAGPFAIFDAEGREVGRTNDYREATRQVEANGGHFDHVRGGTETHAVHTLKLTPALRDAAITKGFPQFAKGGRIMGRRQRVNQVLARHGCNPL